MQHGPDPQPGGIANERAPQHDEDHGHHAGQVAGGDRAVDRIVYAVDQVPLPGVQPPPQPASFTANPVSGAGKIVIEAAPGLGELLTAGEVTPAR